jgi:hypothetical protein
VASAAMGVAAAGTARTVSTLLPGPSVLAQAARLATIIGISLIVLAATARLLRIREFDDAFALVTRLGQRSQ